MVFFFFFFLGSSTGLGSTVCLSHTYTWTHTCMRGRTIAVTSVFECLSFTEGRRPRSSVREQTSALTTHHTGLCSHSSRTSRDSGSNSGEGTRTSGPDVAGGPGLLTCPYPETYPPHSPPGFHLDSPVDRLGRVRPGPHTRSPCMSRKRQVVRPSHLLLSSATCLCVLDPRGPTRGVLDL